MKETSKRRRQQNGLQLWKLYRINIYNNMNYDNFLKCWLEDDFLWRNHNVVKNIMEIKHIKKPR
jgi:hypothetical protein